MNLPQTPIELVVGQLSWVHKNINNNIGFIPADKLDWKPSPTAKSVLEIVNHATGTVNFFTSALKGEEPEELAPVTNAEEAKAMFSKVIEAHISTIQSLSPEELQKLVSSPFGDVPAGFIAGLPVIELINHHGQITYVQTLLGDDESHLIVP